MRLFFYDLYFVVVQTIQIWKCYEFMKELVLIMLSQNGYNVEFMGMSEIGFDNQFVMTLHCYVLIGFQVLPLLSRYTSLFYT